MNKVKVVLANEPTEIRGLLRSLVDSQADMEVVGEETDPVELLILVGDTEADVVLVTIPELGEEPGILSHLLYEYPLLVVLALSADQKKVFLYRQDIRKESLPGGSEIDILGAIRRLTGTDSSKGEEVAH